MDGAAGAKEPIFVGPAQINGIMILPAPPANDSAATKAELAELHHLESTRTPAQVEQAKADDDEEDIFIFRKALGDKFTPAALPLTDTLSNHVRNDSGVNTKPAKMAFNRPRPYNLDTKLKPVCKTHMGAEAANDASYPSGHTTTGYLEALVLAAMVPEKRDAIFARAEDYANNRLICGVHYRSDLDGSKRLSYASYALMTVNPQFQKEFTAARTELREALGLPAVTNRQ
jgi:acid phosphatase (class A)